MARPELEFFLLSAVVSHYHDLSILESPDLGLAVNKRVPKFTGDELIDTLSDLFCGGDITARLVKRNGRSRPLVPARDEIDAALCGALDLEYGLTSQGGARWEAMAQFDWNNYIGTWFEIEHGYEGASQEMLEVYLAWSGCAVPGSEQWSVVRPWKATYWKSLFEGVRVRYLERPSSSTIEYPGFRALWIDEWLRRDDELRTFIPMGPSRTEPTPESGWRIRFRSVARRGTRELLRLLESSDSAIQYAAGLTLAKSGDASFTPALLAWFLGTRRYFALRLVAQIDDPCALDAFIEVFKTEPWSDRRGDTRFRCDLRVAIGRFGAQAVAKLTPLLGSEVIEMQIAVLRTLGATESVEAGTLILKWPHTCRRFVAVNPPGGPQKRWKPWHD
jgi:hypothetical protein